MILCQDDTHAGAWESVKPAQRQRREPQLSSRLSEDVAGMWTPRFEEGEDKTV